MILREVRLENVKSYGSPAVVIEFSRGVNAICGPNGAGKSTILEAIGCALFQHLPYKHEEFVREKESSGTITVVVESRLDGRTYEIVRKVGKGGSHYVHDPDLKQQIAKGEGDVGRWLHQHLRIPASVDLRSLFVDAVGPPQGTLTAVFLDAPQERRSKFHRLLRVDEYDDAFRKLATLETALDKERKDLEVEIARLDGQTRDRPAVALRLQALRDERADLAINLSRALAQRDVVDSLLAEFEQRRQAWEAARVAFDAAATEERHALADLAGSARAYESARAAAETCERTRGAYDDYRASETTLVELEKQRRERDLLRQQRGDLQARIVRAQSEVDQLDAEIARLASGLAEAERLDAMVPRQEAAEKHLQEAITAARAVEQLRESLKKAQTDIQRVGDRGRRLQVEIDRVTALRSIAEDLTRRRAFHEEVSTDLAAANRADGQLHQLRQTIQREQRQLIPVKARLDELDRQIADITALTTPNEPVATLEIRLRELTEARASARSQLGHARETRGQVAGGLCPFLHEECRNLRPGVDLAGHFDAEISHWQVEFERLERDYTTADLATRRARQAEENRRKLAELTQQRGDLAATIEEGQKHLVEVQEKVREAAGLASARTEMEAAERKARTDWQAAEQAAAEVAKLPDLEKEIQEARGEWTALKVQQEADRTQLQALANVDADVQAAREALRALGGPRERANHLRDQAGTLPALRDARVGKDERVSGLRAELATLDEKLAGYAGLDEQLEENGKRRAARHPDYLAYLKAADLAATLDEHSRLHAAAEAAARAANLERARAEAALTSAAEGYDGAEHEDQRRRRGELDQAIGNTRARIESAEIEDETSRNRLAELDRLLEQQAGLARHVDEIDEEKQVAGALRNAIRAAGPEITRQLLAGISATASRINGEVLNQAGIEVSLTNEFEIVTRRQGESRGFGQLSGGEQMAAALAVRLALLRELSDSRVAFLDEPTAHLDQERRSNLGDQVLRLKGFDQLIVISHDDTFDGLFGHVIRIGREDGKSKVLPNE